jgi:hypothetical protein
MSRRRDTDLDSEIANMRQEIGQVEGAGPTFAERFHEVQTDLERAEDHYRRHGFTIIGFSPGEQIHYFRQSVIGSLMVTSRDKLLTAEQERITREIEADPRLKLSTSERDERLRALREELRRAYAQRELGWRAKEAAGETVDRGDPDAEMFLRLDADLKQIAEGREAA